MEQLIVERAAWTWVPGAVRCAVGLLLVVSELGCHGPALRFLPWHHGVPRRYDEKAFASKPMSAYEIPAPPAGEGGLVETVIGRIRTYRIRRGDTLLDVARYHDLGYNEILQANPGVDPWFPPVGATIILPTVWVLPCCALEGLVVNIPEMRLYAYDRNPSSADRILVRTHPVGLGQQEWRTPRGKFRVRTKTVNPDWNIPASIIKERVRENGDARRFIPGGHPENPLGKYRMALTIPGYAIHGTNHPWGVGRQVSHGCTRLYPEDIHHLFPLVEIGTPVEFMYQPVKIGTWRGNVYVEVHPDIYGYGRPTYRQVLGDLARRGLQHPGLDHEALRAALAESRGVPVRVFREPPARTAASLRSD